MNHNLLNFEKKLKECSQNSTEDFLRYVLFEMLSPIEDYYLAIDLLEKYYSENKDIRIAILGAYLTSTWLSFEENRFLPLLDEHVLTADEQNKAIIYYLHAYDIDLKHDTKYPSEYSDYLRKSISYSKRFVYNYVRLAEIVTRKEAHALLNRAIANVVNVWNEEQLKNAPMETFLEYNGFVDEFILGVDISVCEYNELLSKRNSLE